MYRAGHLGIGLLVFAPVGVVLVLAGRADLAVLAEATAVALAMLPDYDHRLPFLTHRGITHTVWFALLVGVVLGGLGWVLGGRPATPTTSELAVFGFGVGTLVVLAHLLGDVLTPAGIRPFWPVWDRTFTLALTRADSTVANYGLLVLGVGVTALAVVTLPDVLAVVG